MSYLFVDTESSDLLKRHLPLSDPSQPWIVSMAGDLSDGDGVPQAFFFTQVRAADGQKVRPGAEQVHGISSRDAAREGVPQIAALAMLCHLASQARYVVGYGLDFDRQLVESALLRSGKDTRLWTRPGLQFINCMLPATAICKLPPKEPRDDGQFKWPSLAEAQQIILGEPPRTGIHNAWDDMQISKRVFMELRRRGVIEVAA